MEIKKPNLNDGDKLSNDTLWEGKSGQLVEHYIKNRLLTDGTDIENLKSKVVSSIDYTNDTLYIYDANKNLLALGPVSVITPTYDAEIHIVGVYQNNSLINVTNTEGSVSKIIVNYQNGNKYYLAVKVLKTASRLGGEPSYLTAPILCTLEVTGNASTPVQITPVINLDEDPFLLDITDIVSSTINSGITFKLTHQFTNDEAVLSKSGELNDVSIMNPRITRTGSGFILTENSITFGIDGVSTDDASDFVYEIYLGEDKSSMDSTNVNKFTSLHGGVNLILILAYNKFNRTISTGWEAFDFIYNDGKIETTQIVVNNIPSDEIANQAVSNLCRVDIYSPNDENVNITAYVEETEPSDISSFKTELSTLLITSDSYTNHIYTNQFSKYIELSLAGKNYLGIKVDNNFYKSGVITTTVANDVWTNNYYPANYWIIEVSKPDPTILPYTTGVGLNFSQSTSTSNNVFTELTDLEVQEGYRLLNGKTVFYISSNSDRKSIYTSKYVDTHMTRTNPFTLEIGLSSLNVSSEDGVLLSLGNIQIKPNEVCWKWDSVSDPNKKTYLNRNAGFNVDEETHIVITYTPSFKVSSGDLYYPDYLGRYQSNYKDNAEIALLKIYINGVIAREINLTTTDLATISNQLNILPTTSDVAISTLRTWSQSALTEALVRLNYIAFLETVDEKKTEYTRNNILNQKGEISWKKARELYNTLVYIYPKGYNVLSRAYGGEDNQTNATEEALKKVPVTLFINYADSEVNKIYGGRLNKLQRKGLGSSAKRYLIWNVLDATEKHKEIKYNDDGKITYKTSSKDKEGNAIYVTEDTKDVTFKTHLVETTYITGKDSDGKYLYLTCEVGSKIPNASKMKSDFISYANLDSDTNTFKKDAVVDTKGILLPNSSTSTLTDDIRIKKLVGKVNFASSMLSHKLGACELYNATNPTIVSGRKAVKELPYLYFYYVADVDNIDNIELKELLDNDSKIKFMGLMTWGSGKCDKNTWDCGDDDVLVIEGAENEDLGTNFRIPWHAYQRLNSNGHLDTNPTTTPEECKADPLAKVMFYNESLFYVESSDMLNASWDFDTNVNELGDGLDTDEAKVSMEKFRLFNDFVYKWDPSYIVASNLTDARTDRKVCITASSLSGFPGHKQYDLYRYDTLNKAWVPAGLYYNAGSWERLNLVDLVKDEQGYNSRAGADAWQDLIRLHFANNIGDYIDITDVAHHQAVIKFLSGTDNRAKNTYFKVTNNNKIILYQDDMDTIFITDNQGKQSKAYNLLEPSYDESYTSYWGDAGLNIFFKTFDLCFESQIKDQLANVCKKANDIIENYFYAILKYFPAVSYNHTARIYYEIGLLIKNTGILHDGDNDPFYKNNGEDPTTLSHGRYLEGEKYFINQRNIFLRSYSLQMTSTDDDLMLSDTGASGSFLNTYVRYTTFQDLYPLLYNRANGGSTYIREVDSTSRYDAIKYKLPKDTDFGKDSKENDIFVNLTSIGASITMYLPMTNQYKTLHIKGFSKNKFQGVFSHLTELTIDQDAGLELGIPKVPFSEITAKFPVIEKLSLIGITLPEILDLSDYEKLLVIDLTNCENVKEIKLPSTQSLKTIILPKSVTKLSLIDLPNLDSVTIEDWSNVKSLNLANVSSKLIQTILGNLTSAPNNIVLGNSNHEISKVYISESVASNILNAKSLTIYGMLTIGESENNLTTISFDTGKKIYRKELNDKFNYDKVSNFTGLKLTTTDITATEGTDLLDYVITTYGNEIKTVTASIKDVNVSRGLISSTMDEGTLSIHINSNNVLRGYVRFTPKDPAIGDWAYIDGTFSSSYTDSKPIAGVVWWIDGDDVYIVHHEAVGSFVIGPDLAYNSTSNNYTNLENETNNGIYTWYSNTNNLSKITSLKNSLNNISITSPSDNTYPVKQTNVLADTFVGRNNTNAVVKALTESGYTYASSTSIDDLKTEGSFTMSDDILKCPYYQAVKLYDPTVGVENPNECYSKGQWYIASYDEWLYVFTAFVASLLSDSNSLFSNKVGPSSSSVNSGLSTSLIVGNAVYPVFCKTSGHFAMETNVYTSSLLSDTSSTSKMNSYVLDKNNSPYNSDYETYSKRTGDYIYNSNWSWLQDWCLNTYKLVPFVIYNKNGVENIRSKYNV